MSTSNNTNGIFTFISRKVVAWLRHVNNNLLSSIYKGKLSKADIIKYVVIGLLVLITAFTITRCSHFKNENSNNMNNIVALTDTIKYYKGKSNELVAQKTMLIGDMDVLKRVNDSLYNIIKDIKVKNPDNVVYINTTVHDIVRDTVWTVNVDSKYIKKEFDFSDKWRSVSGYTYMKHDTLTQYELGTVISKNDVNVDFTVVQKDNQVYITSNNPYINYNNIIGITQNTTQKTKTKRWGIGPYIGFGVTHKFDFVPTIGIGVQYSIIRF